uniref:Phage protein n=1 Tax=Haliea sp. ETY-M TaxID=1055105 RepID=A0A455R326_9GAMM|nr:hypothetical protein [Haliea sp. ETY-M]
MARPWKNLPPGALDLLIAQARNGLRESKAAEALGMRPKDFRRVIKENETARTIWEDALAVERDALIDALYNRAVGGDAKAAQYLLAARHGMSDKAPEAPAQPVSVTFNLPAAMDAREYLNALQAPALEDGTNASQT